MSADSYSRCPHCMQRVGAEAEAAAKAVTEMYGKVPAEEYLAASAALVPVDAAVARMPATFREDYEFYGAHEGTITADYGGECDVCGLTARLKHSVTFYPAPGGVL